MLYLPPWPNVALSWTPGIPSVTLMMIRRTALPTVALARQPGPKTLTPELKPSALAIGPLTTLSGAGPRVQAADEPQPVEFIGLEGSGTRGTGKQLLEHFDLTPEAIARAAGNVISRKSR